MDLEQLYLSCLKMVNDKYKMTNYPKDKFSEIFNNTYKENNRNVSNPTNEINKQILIKIRNEIEDNFNNYPNDNHYDNNNDNNNDNRNDNHNDNHNLIDNQKINIEAKLKEIEDVRASMNLLSSTATDETQEQLLEEGNYFGNNNNNNNESKSNHQQPSLNSIQITNNNPTSFNKFRTFIINTSNNNIRISPTIDISSSIIYPCCLCIPTDIKNRTPYLLLSINDGTKVINYTYLPNKCFDSWDIWTPATDNYININLNTNNWNISLLDFNGTLIDFSCYYYPIIDVLENTSNNSFSIRIDENHNNNFYPHNKIKIIKEDGSYIDNSVIGNNNNRIIIKKNNLHLNDFINSTIYNYNNKCSLLFKYYSK